MMHPRCHIALLAACLLFVGGCGGTEDTGQDTAQDDTPPDAAGWECDELSLDIDGTTEPVVGDTWVVWLWCDDTLMAGVSRLSFDPPDFATIDNNEATFLYAGQATMQMQVGSLRATQEVTVAEAK